MVLTDTRSHVDIGSIPAYCAESVDACIYYLGGRIVTVGDRRWSDKGDNVIINDKRYYYEDLAISNQLVTDADFYDLLKRTANYPDADTYADRAYLSNCFLEPFSWPEPIDPRVLEQLRILWHIARDPFLTLLQNVRLTPEQCADRFAIDGETMQGWLSGDVPVPPYVRLMIAAGTGVLGIRGFT